MLEDYILRGLGFGNRLTVGMVVNPRGSACGIVAAAAAFFSCWALRRAALPSSSSFRVRKACRPSCRCLLMVLSIGAPLDGLTKATPRAPQLGIPVWINRGGVMPVVTVRDAHGDAIEPAFEHDHG